MRENVTFINRTRYCGENKNKNREHISDEFPELKGWSHSSDQKPELHGTLKQLYEIVKDKEYLKNPEEKQLPILSYILNLLINGPVQ